MCLSIAEMKLEDVFKSTQEQFNASPDSNRLLAVLLGAAGIVLLLVLFNQRTKRQAAPKALNNPRKLLRQMLRQLPLRSNELKQLQILSQNESCNPLVLLLCPSALASAIQKRPPSTDRKTLIHLARKAGITVTSEPSKTA